MTDPQTALVEVSGEGSRVTDLPPDAPWWARMLVSNWQDFWKWLSTWFIALAAAAPLAFEHLPEMKQYVSETTFHNLEAALVFLILLARLKRQQPKEVK